MSIRKVAEVKLVNEKRGYGWIQPLDEGRLQHFFHFSQVENRVVLQVGDLVSFELEPSDRKPGMECAVRVRFSKRDGSPATSITAKEIL